MIPAAVVAVLPPTVGEQVLVLFDNEPEALFTVVSAEEGGLAVVAASGASAGVPGEAYGFDPSDDEWRYPRGEARRDGIAAAHSRRRGSSRGAVDLSVLESDPLTGFYRRCCCGWAAGVCQKARAASAIPNNFVKLGGDRLCKEKFELDCSDLRIDKTAVARLWTQRGERDLQEFETSGTRQRGGAPIAAALDWYPPEIWVGHHYSSNLHAEFSERVGGKPIVTVNAHNSHGPDRRLKHVQKHGPAPSNPPDAVRLVFTGAPEEQRVLAGLPPADDGATLVAEDRAALASTATQMHAGNHSPNHAGKRRRDSQPGRGSDGDAADRDPASASANAPTPAVTVRARPSDSGPESNRFASEEKIEYGNFVTGWAEVLRRDQIVEEHARGCGGHLLSREDERHRHGLAGTSVMRCTWGARCEFNCGRPGGRRVRWSSSPWNPDGARLQRGRTVTDFEINDLDCQMKCLTNVQVESVNTYLENIGLTPRHHDYLDSYAKQIQIPAMEAADLAEDKRCFEERPGRVNGEGGEVHTQFDGGHSSARRAFETNTAGVDGETGLINSCDTFDREEGHAAVREDVGAHAYVAKMELYKVDGVSYTLDHCRGSTNRIFAEYKRQYTADVADKGKLMEKLSDIWHSLVRVKKTFPKFLVLAETAIDKLAVECDTHARGADKQLDAGFFGHMCELLEEEVEDFYKKSHAGFEAAAAAIQAGEAVDWATLREDMDAALDMFEKGLSAAAHAVGPADAAGAAGAATVRAQEKEGEAHEQAAAPTVRNDRAADNEVRLLLHPGG
jgi:hypothetical protein